MYVSSYCYICVLILLYMCPRTDISFWYFSFFLISFLSVVSFSFSLRCVNMLVDLPALFLSIPMFDRMGRYHQHMCVLILLYICPHTAICLSSYCYMSVLILLCVCSRTAIYVSSYCYVCTHTPIYMFVSSYCYVSVLILLYVCPHTVMFVSSYCYICVLMLL